tara:strand:+ start:1317 stop:1646 length:330 start_codon:yes stop_codon:yes gene_type:complete
MRNHVFEEAMLTLLSYTEEADGVRNKAAVIKEFGIAAYLIALACEELEESLAEIKSGRVKNKAIPLRLWPEAHEHFTEKVDRDLINEIFFTTVTESRGVLHSEGPEGEQ